MVSRWWSAGGRTSCKATPSQVPCGMYVAQPSQAAPSGQCPHTLKCAQRTHSPRLARDTPRMAASRGHSQSQSPVQLVSICRLRVSWALFCPRPLDGTLLEGRDRGGPCADLASHSTQRCYLPRFVGPRRALSWLVASSDLPRGGHNRPGTIQHPSPNLPGQKATQGRGGTRADPRPQVWLALRPGVGPVSLPRLSFVTRPCLANTVRVTA